MGFAGIGGSAAASEPENLTEAQRAAIASYQDETGASESVAENVIADQTSISQAVDAAGLVQGVDYDLWTEPSTNGQDVFLRTSSSASEDVLAAADLSSETSVTVVKDAAIGSDSATELSETVEETVDAIVPDVQGIYVDVTDGTLVVQTSADQTPAAGDIDVPGFENVRVEQIDAPMSDSIAVRGGVAMSGCTAAFPATSGSYIGFYSAAHCGGPTTVCANTTGSGTGTTATIRSRNHGANADIAFYSIANTNTISRTFFGSSSTTATATSGPGSVGEGFTVCHRGKTTGWNCGKVQSIAFKPTWANACNGATCNAVFVSVSARQDSGDSGGPWVSSNTAIGVHKGGSTTQAVYSKMSYVPSGTSMR